jgi:hypothetical protein
MSEMHEGMPARAVGGWASPRRAVGGSASPRREAGAWASLVQQVWLLGVSRRWAYLIAAFMAWIGIFHVLPKPNGMTAVYPSIIAGIIAASAWPLITWNGEAPSRRAYHWSLPVARLPHDLARVAAGALYLLVGLAALAAGCAMLAWADGSFEQLRAIPAIVWASFFTGPMIAYLLVSPIALWNEYRVTRYAIIGFIILGALAGFVGGPFEWIMVALMQPILSGETFGLAEVLVGVLVRVASDTAVGNPVVVPTSWWGAVALWFGIGITANVVAAAWRPDDLRRLAAVTVAARTADDAVH